jgi:hypothetical protein
VFSFFYDKIFERKRGRNIKYLGSEYPFLDYMRGIKELEYI